MPRMSGSQTRLGPSLAGRILFPAWVACVLAWSDGVAADALWDMHVEPLLRQHCTECHNPAKTKSGLDLTSLQSMLRGGDRGPALVPGRPADSHLYQFLQVSADPHMPPGSRRKLDEQESGLIRTWIEKLPVAAAVPGQVPGTNAASPPVTAVPAKPPLAWKPAANQPPEQVVDRFLELAWKRDKVTPVDRASDAVFVRRVYLDLAGRVPERAEAEAFVRERGRDKRARLIDRLLAGEDYARHLREVFDPVLMDRRGPGWEERRQNERWFAWLEDAFGRNRPWDEVVRDLIVARPARPEDRGAVWFLYERENNAQAVAEALAPVVFGVQMKCAQCHDHMVAREIKQAHYWGMVSAFNRSRNVSTPAGPAVSESAIGGFVSFANLQKESQPARLVFFNGRAVDEPWPKEGAKESDAPELYRVPPNAPAPGTAEKEKGKGAANKGGKRRSEAERVDRPAVPKFSRREALAEAVTRNNPLLARAMVNRIWAMLFGRGLVHPVDLMDSKHPPSHPELLDWLARDFERSGYDVKRLVRILANTRAYQLDSRMAARGRAASPDAFARALDKPLTAEQLQRSLLLASGNAPDAAGRVAGFTPKELQRAFVAQFPDLFPAEYNASLQQALFLSNARFLDALVKPAGTNLAARLLAVPEASARVREAFVAVYGREPDREEARACRAYVAARSPEQGVRQLLWALLAGAEFQINH